MRRRITKVGLVIAFALALVLSVPVEALACTQFYLGSETTENGSTIWGRSEDISTQFAKVYTVQQAADHRKGDMMVYSDGFKYPYPEHTLRYTMIKDSLTNENITPESYAEAGINEKGVAVSATVTLGSPKTAIIGSGKPDPWVKTLNGGVAETHTASLVLMQAETARHGVEVLAEAYDTYGSAGREGTTISDGTETWFMHSLSGHQYVAIKLPSNKIGFSPNLTMLQSINITDTENVIASDDLIAIPIAASTFVAGADDDPGSPEAVDGHTSINIAQSYANPTSNVPNRLYQGYYYLKGVDEAKALVKGYFDYFIEPRAGGNYTLYEAMRLLAYHGNPDDPTDGKYYKRPTSNSNGMSNPSMVEAHVFETRSNMPDSLTTIEWLAVGPAEFSIYIPGYGSLITETEEHYAHDAEVKTTNADADANKDKSASQVFRQIYAIINASDTARDTFDPLVAPLIEKYQKSIIDQQAAIDEAMVALHNTNPDELSKMATELNKSLCAQAYEFGFSLLTDLRAIRDAGYPADAALSEATVKMAEDGADYRMPYQAISVEFSAIEHAGVSTLADSLGVKITFNTSVEGLTADSIIVTNGSGAVIPGTLTGSGTEWYLSFDSVTTEGEISVEIVDWGIYGVATTPQTIPVYKLSTDRVAVEISGASRVETAAQNALKAYPSGCDTVIISTAQNFPDALSASTLAGAIDAPILLTMEGALSEATVHTIGKLGVSKTIIIGSETVISSDIAKSLESLTGSKPLRLSGKDRIATQEAVFKYGLEKNYWTSGDVIVATGMNFPDALSISSYAAATKTPLFLIGGAGQLTDSQKDLISKYATTGSRAIVTGSETVVSAAAAKSLSDTGFTVSRLAGGVNNSYSNSRYGTSAAIAEFSISEGLSANKVAFATGQKFPDALVAGPTQAKVGSFVVLTDLNNGVVALDSAQALHQKAPGCCYELRFLGTTQALSQEARNAVQGTVWR